MGYERCGEFPLIISRLKVLFPKKLRYLDIGSGASVLPTYLLKKTEWDITCVDKFSWVQRQHIYAQQIMKNEKYQSRFHILEQDFLETDLLADSFDIITNISVIEHFDDHADSLVMEKSAKLLKPTGIYLLTTLINDGYFKEFYLKKNVYGEKYNLKPVFFQRHYDVPSFEKRIIGVSGLEEKERVYFGDYDFQFFEHFIDVPWPWKPLKIFYQWTTPFWARRFLAYRDYPLTRANMKMYTASGIFVVLEKPQRCEAAIKT